MISQLAEILVPVFLTAGIGYGWEKLGVEFPTQFVTRATVYVLTPCLVFGTMAGLEISLAAYGQVALATVMVMVAVAAIGVLALKAARLPLRAFMPPIIVPNAGNLGLPLGLFAFGETGLALAIASYTIYAFAQYTVCQLIAAGRMSWALVTRQPIIYSIGLALVFMVLDRRPPEWALNTVNLIGGAVIPLNLMALGVALARLEVAALGRSTYVALVRIGAGLVVGLGVAAILDLDPVAAGVVVLQAAGPSALFAYLWAQLYNNNPEQVAGVVMVSTVISLATLPLLLLLVL